jgi:BirA family biotin operon repressor/biotin-[acetyl-CoA-carboxylase] ligase
VDTLPIPDLPGHRHLALGDVSSTNAVALEMAAAGEPGQLWVTAKRQLKGRGRRGRAWVSEEGNLYASLLLIDPAPLAKLSSLPLVAAVAVYRALKPLFAATPQALAIKWPNDILVDGKKINGILLESGALPDGRMAVVIGCGVNCRRHPENPAYPATDLAECGFDKTPGELFLDLARSMTATLRLWKRGDGFADIREEWLRAARGVGEPVTVNLHEGRIDGVFVEIDADGYLCLATADGELRRISAGDLFFREHMETSA